MASSASSFAGQLLVATPLLLDPNFARAVLLLVDHDDAGAIGVVLNRPGEMLVREVTSALAPGAAAPAHVFLGGPVSPEVVVCLSAARDAGLCSWTVLDPADPPELSGPLRVFQGYAGWGPDQLEGELAAGAWWLLAPHPSDVFCERPAHLWSDVLRRQPPPLAWAATLPLDPSLN
ncbi:MAG: YqgE/AlgH family protein [Mycobacteriales bacterium]